MPAAASTLDSLRSIPLHHRAAVRAIRLLETDLTPLSDLQLRAHLATLRQNLRTHHGSLSTDHSTVHSILPEVFAAVAVAAQRTIGLRPYNVQLLAGIELARGRIAEMATGEGKTLVATLPATLHALTGKGVHIVTVNDYLAARDAQTMGPIYNLLGLSVGVIVSGLTDDQRRAAYRCDITYGTNKEFGFDYLRDQIKLHQKTEHRPIDLAALLDRREIAAPVMRQLHYAIVDEADSILIDESRTPLIIAAESGESKLAWAFQWADQLAARFRPRHDFDLKADKRTAEWKDAGLARLQKVLAETNTPSVSGESWQHLVLNALRARWLYEREQHYVIAGNEVVIVDEFTGRRMPGRTWADGLHQAIGAKERLPVNEPAETLARTTYQHFFGLYQRLAGMTGTAATERAEFKKVYNVHVIPIPTHRPVRREMLPDMIFRTAREKWHAVAAEIKGVTATGRPVLVGTHSIEDSEVLAHLLRKLGIAHRVLNAKPENAAKEAEIIAQAGQRAAVTIATNMAGRGTDIVLHPEVAARGGLHIIATQRHESRRVDRQLIGRCARQGDPGSARFILSLQDAILRHTIDRRRLLRLRRRMGTGPHTRGLGVLFQRAQCKIETLHYRMRCQLMEYEDWLNEVYHQMGT